MKRASVAILSLLALAAAPLSLHAQAEVSDPSLGPVVEKKEAEAEANAPADGGAQAPVELYRSAMSKILVKTNLSDQVDGGLTATVSVVSAQGHTYNYVLQSKNGADNLQAALILARELQGCKKLVITKWKVLEGAGTMMEAFTLHTFDNT